jgi:tellurite resistance protein
MADCTCKTEKVSKRNDLRIRDALERQWERQLNESRVEREALETARALVSTAFRVAAGGEFNGAERWAIGHWKATGRLESPNY